MATGSCDPVSRRAPRQHLPTTSFRILKGGRNVHLSSVHIVLRDISALVDPSWGSWLPTLIPLAWKQKRGGGGGEEGMEGRREAVEAKILIGATAPRAKFWWSVSPTWAKNAANIFGNFFSPIFVLQFPGKVGARNFMKNPREVSRAEKQNSFTARLWELWGAISFWQRTKFRRCPSTVSCTVSCMVPSGESPNFRWTPSWEPN